MSSSKITIKNYIHKKYINKNENKKIIKNYTKIFNEVNFEIKNPKKNLNVLNKNFEFNFKSSDLKRFKNYKTVVVIGECEGIKIKMYVNKEKKLIETAYPIK